jgi:hypothetical protein
MLNNENETPSTADYTTGRWTFNDSQMGVYLTGWAYDLYAASADLLEAWAAKVSVEFDFTADGSSFSPLAKGRGTAQAGG